MSIPRIAEESDLGELRALMTLAIARNQDAFLSPAQVAASAMVMGLDTQLIADRTYYLVEQDGRIAGCGGWSFRATTYGGDASAIARDAALLDPARDPARIRAMYTHPDFTRRGIGRIVLAACEAAAREAGFGSAVLMATLSGEPLYRSAGYRPVRDHVDLIDGVEVPLILMEKVLA